MKDTITKLKNERTELKARISKINNAIDAMQEICTHKYEDGKSAFECIGNDSHKNHYECQICGKTDHY